MARTIPVTPFQGVPPKFDKLFLYTPQPRRCREPFGARRRIRFILSTVPTMILEQRCKAIRLILSDVDGVLTDGRLVFDNQGIETKHFHVRDGLGVRLWQRAGYRFGLLTHRSSHIVKVRAAELGISILRQGTDDKLAALRGILRELQLTPADVCYLGDDLPDLPVVRAVGLGVAVADACGELRQAAHYVTTCGGGAGAIRETIELILKAQSRWDDVIQTYR
ncbi:MAG: HAD hydrolase family protein [Thermoguttaceae bacterium]